MKYQIILNIPKASKRMKGLYSTPSYIRENGELASKIITAIIDGETCLPAGRPCLPAGRLDCGCSVMFDCEAVEMEDGKMICQEHYEKYKDNN